MKSSAAPASYLIYVSQAGVDVLGKFPQETDRALVENVDTEEQRQQTLAARNILCGEEKTTHFQVLEPGTPGAELAQLLRNIRHPMRESLRSSDLTAGGNPIKIPQLQKQGLKHQAFHLIVEGELWPTGAVGS